MGTDSVGIGVATMTQKRKCVHSNFQIKKNKNSGPTDVLKRFSDHPQHNSDNFFVIMSISLVEISFKSSDFTCFSGSNNIF